MGHHHHHGSKSGEMSLNELLPTIFEKDDLVFLGVLKPLLSPKAQKIVELLVPADQSGSAGISELLKRMGPKLEAGPFKDLLPVLMRVAPQLLDEQGKINPAGLVSLVGGLANKKED